MFRPLAVAACLPLLLAGSAAAAPAQVSSNRPGPAWPDSEVPNFVFRHLDLTTFRNSTGGLRENGRFRFFPELNIEPTQSTDSSAVHEDEEWSYAVRVLARRDFNGDGLEDLAICFHDRARNGGTYDVVKPMLVERLGDRVIALSFEIDGEPGTESCPPSAR